MTLRHFSSFSTVTCQPYHFQRLFHICMKRLEVTHYETLQIPINATPSEVKKAFYSLSKSCHPDHNPSDPEASNRFITLSTAYSVLSTPSERSSYDRKILRETQTEPIPHGTFSSTNPAGGRSPSGLSKRRAQFRGPPPSFYRNGGWGSYAQKRRDAQSENKCSAESETHQDMYHTYYGKSTNFKPGQNYYEYVTSNRLHHFDREQHLRTQENHRRRRQSKGKGGIEGSGEELPKSLLGSFLAVSGILTVGIFLPLTFLNSIPF
ncbi:hypothetical protein Golomagni_03974 [Golovinomyces magnicellulatus]|nr:hypothetical protein Golomagni_03974 [Golovinomyces magnicellulatus]